MPEEIRERAPLVLRAVPAHAADRHGTVIDNGVIIRLRSAASIASAGRRDAIDARTCASRASGCAPLHAVDAARR